MYIYKIINKINGKWYIGKQVNENSYYLGSGRALKNAINKYGKECFDKIILEHCESKELLNEREKYWISITDAVNDPNSYNLAQGGEGGDLNKYIDYKKRGNKTDNFAGKQKWWNNLTEKEKEEWLENNRLAKCKGWYVSRIDNPSEIFVKSISRWCEENGVDKSMPTVLNNPKSRLFQKQTKGWRIRRSDMPPLPPYENLRGKVVVDNNCKGKTWELVNGKRVWKDKYQ